MNEYKYTGAVKALIAEYKKAVFELKRIIKPLSKEDLVKVRDADTKDQDCISIQSVLAHVVSSGYNYIILIRKNEEEELDYSKQIELDSAAEYLSALDQMIDYNVNLFEDYPKLEIEQKECANKLHTRWGQYYDPEQLLEHAIVHILRHRRQIEQFLLYS
ncbi:MAG: putative damage-inducible protein DinB [Limisphaerales bacterium]|jgi:uncharacterized damage-inducible protein DinB